MDEQHHYQSQCHGDNQQQVCRDGHAIGLQTHLKGIARAEDQPADDHQWGSF